MPTIRDSAYGLVPICSIASGLHYLLILHNKGHWGFPKGHKDAGESDLETACREFREEVGLETFTVWREELSFQKPTSSFRNRAKRSTKPSSTSWLASLPLQMARYLRSPFSPKSWLTTGGVCLKMQQT